eukprot:CAMPEP_0174335726 /NCGR_PEP_ID=MMETSP0810-20121108/21027_1 /TAXON_ID=73025 ORGANISM="Eutreptiella gymnastica-like, Strain CCMP1594" /NCGR_SAMPLE_ID=MMETSP0810 /ASSEMBLY_ACC=CAM_ASM_000659 /LENGTH=60 /DNA_ID=CAMNT_0015454305 /DNA_START=313 /DNA_END=495 /DNA_ORIENTATION=+
MTQRLFLSATPGSQKLSSCSLDHKPGDQKTTARGAPDESIFMLQGMNIRTRRSMGLLPSL